MFSPGNLYTGKNIATVFEDADYATYLPPRDGLEVAKIMNLGKMGFPDAGIIKTLTDDVYKAIFALDVYQLIERCDVLVFNMNGRAADDGSISETAMAYALGKPLVIYKDDPRSEFNGRDNPLLTGLSLTFATESCQADLPGALKAVQEQFTFPSTDKIMANLPDTVRGAVDAGRAIWNIKCDYEKRIGEDKETPSTTSTLAGLVSSAVPALGGAGADKLGEMILAEIVALGKKLGIPGLDGGESSISQELGKMLAMLKLGLKDLYKIFILLLVLKDHLSEVELILAYFQTYKLPDADSLKDPCAG